MPWYVAVSIVVLLVALAGLFIFFARLIRRDVNERFDRLRGRLEEEANEIVDDLLNEDGNRSAGRD